MLKAMYHATKSYPKEKGEKPTCANCKGDHTAIYEECISHPKNAPFRDSPMEPGMKYA
jgi:hypothetical protein